MGALVHNLAVLDDSERHHVVGHDGIHDTEVGLPGAIKISDEVPDFGVQVARNITVDIFGIGIVNTMFLQVVQEALMEGCKNVCFIVQYTGK